MAFYYPGDNCCCSHYTQTDKQTNKNAACFFLEAVCYLHRDECDEINQRGAFSLSLCLKIYKSTTNTYVG